MNNSDQENFFRTEQFADLKIKLEELGFSFGYESHIFVTSEQLSFDKNINTLSRLTRVAEESGFFEKLIAFRGEWGVSYDFVIYLLGLLHRKTQFSELIASGANPEIAEILWLAREECLRG